MSAIDVDEILEHQLNANMISMPYHVYAQLFDSVAALGKENAKLRELCADMWFWGYEGHIDSESQEQQMRHIDGVLDRMRELGVEASE